MGAGPGGAEPDRVAAVLPAGVRAGSLLRRALAAVLDALLPGLLLLGLGLALVWWGEDPVAMLVLVLVTVVLCLFWALVVWFLLATGAASPGMRLLRLQLVGLADGRAIGWGRVLLRQLVWSLLGATGIGLVVLGVTILTDVRRQGLHDRAARAVVIEERTSRPAAPVAATASPTRQGAPVATTVGLPAHLTGRTGFDATPGERSAPAPGSSPSAPDGQTASSPPPAAAAGWTPPGAPEAPSGPAGAASPDERSRWGRPPAAPPRPVPPVPAPNSGAPASPEDPPDDGTRLVPREGLGRRAPEEGWLLVLADGREIAVSGLVLIGRNPQPRHGEQVAELVTVDDDSRTVSKTHVAIGIDQRGPYLVDRGSTNGSSLATATGEHEPCPPGEVVRLRDGQLVWCGQQRLEVRRRIPG